MSVWRDCCPGCGAEPGARCDEYCPRRAHAADCAISEVGARHGCTCGLEDKKGDCPHFIVKKVFNDPDGAWVCEECEGTMVLKEAKDPTRGTLPNEEASNDSPISLDTH